MYICVIDAAKLGWRGGCRKVNSAKLAALSVNTSYEAVKGKKQAPANGQRLAK